jgi:hypothetical protein
MVDIIALGRLGMYWDGLPFDLPCGKSSFFSVDICGHHLKMVVKAPR